MTVQTGLQMTAPTGLRKTSPTSLQMTVLGMTVLMSLGMTGPTSQRVVRPRDSRFAPAPATHQRTVRPPPAEDAPQAVDAPPAEDTPPAEDAPPAARAPPDPRITARRERGGRRTTGVPRIMELEDRLTIEAQPAATRLEQKDRLIHREAPVPTHHPMIRWGRQGAGLARRTTMRPMSLRSARGCRRRGRR